MFGESSCLAYQKLIFLPVFSNYENSSTMTNKFHESLVTVILNINRFSGKSVQLEEQGH